MKLNTKYLSVLLPLLTGCILLSGCLPTFDNAVVPTNKERVEPLPYLGVWKISKIYGKKPGEDVFISVQKSDGNLQCTVSPKQKFTKNAGAFDPVLFQLCRLGKEVFLFGQSKSGVGGWQVGRIGLRKNGKEIGIESLNLIKLAADVHKRVAQGQIGSREKGDIHLTGSKEDVRNYLTRHAQFGEIIVLSRLH